MTELQKSLLFISTVALVGCTGSGGGSASKSCAEMDPYSLEYFEKCEFQDSGDDSVNVGGGGNEAPTPTEECVPVDATELFEKIHGSWEYYNNGLRSPICTTTSEGPANSYVSFDKYDQSIAHYSRVFTDPYQGTIDCTRGSFDRGGIKKISEESQVEVCQTNASYQLLGSRGYFINENGYYRLIAYTEDTLGRTVLLYSHSISNHPTISEGSYLHTYINHRSYNSVEIP
ncbi:MAG: hypothetical protein CL677_09300 [Bdellovibrionaceae bacterium]|nr:hypothetical protein [Pseudobdellovibrionaceae bacterium]|tara:strand:+ start:171875 stop:172564 length:690 start_codon:yes stop_codon:yes gene_type:complete